MKHVVTVGGGIGGWSLVDPEGTGVRSWILWSHAFPENIQKGAVTAVEPQAVVLSDGARIPFDDLVLAPGTRYPPFQAAQGYLVVGGGVVGVELAGELAGASGQRIRLAHRGPRLVEGLHPKASTLARRHLESLGVEVLLNTSDAQPLPGEETDRPRFAGKDPRVQPASVGSPQLEAPARHEAQSLFCEPLPEGSGTELKVL